jgi:hypothetical protein
LLQESWQASVFLQHDVLSAVDINEAFVSMHSAFSRCWSSAALQHNVPASFLTVGLTLRLSDKNARSCSLTDVLSHFAVAEAGEPGNGFWIFPKETIARYSNILIALTYWRWLEHLTSLIWQISMKHRIPECFIFTSVARAVFGQLAGQIWNNLKVTASNYVESLKKTLLLSCPVSVEDFTDEHNSFLSLCTQVTLLTPAFSRVRRTLRALAHQVEAMAQFLNSLPDAKGRGEENETHRDFVAKKVVDFVVTTQLCARHIEESSDAQTSKGIAEILRFTLSGSAFQHLLVAGAGN